MEKSTTASVLSKHFPMPISKSNKDNYNFWMEKKYYGYFFSVCHNKDSEFLTTAVVDDGTCVKHRFEVISKA